MAALFCVLVAFLAFSLFSKNQESNQKQAELDKLNAQYEQQINKNKEIENAIKENDEAALAEKYARENGYVKTDERVYIDITPGNN